jgi:hypothetical protein
LFNLQAGFGQRGSGEPGGTFFERKTKYAARCNREQRILDHV